LIRNMRKRAENFVPDPTSMLAVYTPGADGRAIVCIGFIMSRRTDFEAFNANNKSIGHYLSQRAAADALSSEATS
jgi:hypothetical protein